MNLMIPIFPLNLVVFPGSRYPLHIFEERYKKMVERCLKDNSGFGIITMVGNELARIGSYVRIKEVTKKFENGEMDIIVEGVNRFQTTDIRVHKDGYYQAFTKDYSDFSYEIDNSLQLQLKERFEELLEKFNFHLDENFWNNYQLANRKSFKIAEKSGLSIDQQQEFLMIRNENQRMHFLLAHFERLDKEISKNLALRAIILGDGYIP
jgi:ATP-dependent Lon protease